MKPELLMPVGTREMLDAAIHNGADAVYYGVPHWNARGRTEDFTFDDVREMIRYARVRGVRTYLAMNILIFQREIQELPDFLEKLIALEPDGFIIQDIGLARLIRAIAPTQEIHASTQMTLASAEAVNLVSQLGFNRAVLARELSLKQIQAIKDSTHLELEVFIHGALCVSYSGQCLTSENFGGRSANRGQCAQSCRLPYRIFVDGKEFRDTNAQYLFSTRDLCAIPRIGELSQMGIESLKVEGRLKSPEYVAAVAKAYRKVIDVHNTPLTQEDMEPLEVLFSRGLGTGWLDGDDHQKLVDGTFSNHHGAFLGTIEKIDRNGFLVSTVDEPSMPIPGDGILCESPEFNVSFGGRLYNVKKMSKGFWIDLGRDFNYRRLAPHMKVYRNDSPALEKNLRNTFSNRENFKHIPIKAYLSGNVGKQLLLTLIDPEGNKAVVQSEQVLDKANVPNPAKTAELVEKELSALSNSAYSLGDLDIQVSSDAFIPGKILRGLRQEAVAALDEKRCHWKPLAPKAELGKNFISSITQKSIADKVPQKQLKISVLVRKPEQIEALKGLSIDNVIMDFDWGVKYEKPLEQIREFGFKAGMATLRIHKPGENHYLKNILKLAPDFALVRNLGALAILKENGIPLTGDYSLNATNSLTYDWLLSQGLQTLHPSWDLNSTQLFELLNNINGNRLELALHQYMPAFHSEYCAFARSLTSGRRFPECEKICTKHKVEILDHKGERHFLQSDAECRNTLFVGKPQSALKLLPRLLSGGVGNFRLEMLDETPEMVQRKIQVYAQAIRGKMDIEEASRLVGVEEKYGLSEGQLFNESVWVDRKKN